jgi:colanic acid biosynthesis glycosyl transferase WcaI
MRITIVNQFYPPDLAPTAHLAASLARHRSALGDDVTVITGTAGYVPGASRSADEADDRVTVVRVATPGGGKSSVVSRLAGYLGFHVMAMVRLITLPRQDVIVALTTPPYIVVGPMLVRFLRRRTRVILWSMDVYPDAAERFDQLDPAGPTSRVLRALNRWIYPRLDHLVVLDDAMAGLLLGQYGKTGKPPHSVIPNWEPASLFPTRASVDHWKGFDSPDLAGRTVIAYTGNAGTGHRFDTVAAAAGRLDADHDAFLFVGGGVRWGEIESASTALSTGGGAPLVLRGYVDKADIPSILAGARATLITLDDQALGLMSPSKLHSSLAMACPVVYVGPEGSNVDTAITRFDCGVSLRHGDVDGLVDAVTRLRCDDEFHARLSAHARRAFDEAYCDSVALPRFDEIIDQS